MKRIIAILPLVALLCCNTNLRSKQSSEEALEKCKNECEIKQKGEQCPARCDLYNARTLCLEKAESQSNEETKCDNIFGLENDRLYCLEGCNKQDERCRSKCDLKKTRSQCLIKAKNEKNDREKCEEEYGLNCPKICKKGPEGKLCRSLCRQEDQLKKLKNELQIEYDSCYERCGPNKSGTMNECQSLCMNEDRLREESRSCLIEYEENKSKSEWCKERAECKAKCKSAKDYPCLDKCDRKYRLNWCLERAGDDQEKKQCANSGEACQKTCAPGITGDFCRAKCKLQDELNSCFADWGKENETRIKSCKDDYNQDKAFLECNASCPDGETGDLCRWRCTIDKAYPECLKEKKGKKECDCWAICAKNCDLKNICPSYVDEANQACVNRCDNPKSPEWQTKEECLNQCGNKESFINECKKIMKEHPESANEFCSMGCALKCAKERCLDISDDTKKKACIQEAEADIQVSH